MEPTLKKGDRCFLDGTPATVTRHSKSRDGFQRIRVTPDKGSRSPVTFEWGSRCWYALGSGSDPQPCLETPRERAIVLFRRSIRDIGATGSTVSSRPGSEGDWDELIANLRKLTADAADIREQLFGAGQEDK